jgi:hypothetical protein
VTVDNEEVQVKFGLVMSLVLLMVPPAIEAGTGAQSENGSAVPLQPDYGVSFFDQLRLIFGRFQDADLQRAFQAARPIKCSDLISNEGEWRDVAFFNENRKIGDWYRKSIDEVRHDLAV